jgi:hypothetical protein
MVSITNGSTTSWKIQWLYTNTMIGSKTCANWMTDASPNASPLDSFNLLASIVTKTNQATRKIFMIS